MSIQMVVQADKYERSINKVGSQDCTGIRWDRNVSTLRKITFLKVPTCLVLQLSSHSISALANVPKELLYRSESQHAQFHISMTAELFAKH